jgi:hypothetical protein
MTTNALDDRVTKLLKEAAEWRLLGRLLERPSPEWLDDVERLRREMPEGASTNAALAAREASEGEYHFVFGPGGPAPPREASYHASVELGGLLAAIEGDYAAFAYQPVVDEPADHVAVETGFIAYLRLKEAYALASGDHEAAGIAQRVASRFIAEHLAVIAHPLAGLLAESGIDYLARTAALVAARTGPKPRGRQLPVIQPNRTDDDGGGEFACDL